MLYLTLHDDPFSGQERDETALLEVGGERLFTAW